MEEFILILLVSEEELMELDRDFCPIWKEGGMSCEEEEFKETFHFTNKECRMQNTLERVPPGVCIVLQVSGCRVPIF